MHATDILQVIGFNDWYLCENLWCNRKVNTLPHFLIWPLQVDYNFFPSFCGTISPIMYSIIAVLLYPGGVFFWRFFFYWEWLVVLSIELHKVWILSNHHSLGSNCMAPVDIVNMFFEWSIKHRFQIQSKYIAQIKYKEVLAIFVLKRFKKINKVVSVWNLVHSQ